MFVVDKELQEQDFSMADAVAWKLSRKLGVLEEVQDLKSIALSTIHEIRNSGKEFNVDRQFWKYVHITILGRMYDHVRRMTCWSRGHGRSWHAYSLNDPNHCTDGDKEIGDTFVAPVEYSARSARLEEIRKAIRKEASGMKSNYRTMILDIMDGKSLAEIADKFNVSVSAVSQWKAIAFKLMKPQLEREFR